MYIMDQVEDFASKHIEDIISKESVTPDCIEMLGELVDIVKDVSEYRKNNSTTYAMDSYSPATTVEMTRRYADNMPHTYGRQMPYNNMYGNMYGNKADLIEMMKQHLAQAQTEQEKQTIQDCINRMSKI